MPLADFPEFHVRSRSARAIISASQLERGRRQRARGLCARCDEPARPGKRSCPAHAHQPHVCGECGAAGHNRLTCPRTRK